jgi:hypothetical protein
LERFGEEDLVKTNVYLNGWININGRNPNGNVQLSVVYLGPLPTLNSH